MHTTSILLHLLLVAALTTGLSVGCNDDDSNPPFTLPDTVIVCDPPTPCGGAVGGGSGGGGSFTSEDFSDQGGNGGGGGGGGNPVLSIEGLQAARDNLGLQLVIANCQDEQSCAGTFTAKNEGNSEANFELRFSPNSEYEEVLELMTGCNKALTPSQQCNSTLTFGNFPVNFERECIGELSYLVNGFLVFRFPACAESQEGACFDAPCFDQP